MTDFQLILFSEANRPVRKAQESGAFSLIQFSERTRTGMGSALSEKSEIKPEDIAAWYSPMEACAYAATCVGVKEASDALWQLLEGGMIEAVAGSSSMTPHERDRLLTISPSSIPKRMWKSMSATGTDLYGARRMRDFGLGERRINSSELSSTQTTFTKTYRSRIPLRVGRSRKSQNPKTRLRACQGRRTRTEK